MANYAPGTGQSGDTRGPTTPIPAPTPPPTTQGQPPTSGYGTVPGNIPNPEDYPSGSTPIPPAVPSTTSTTTAPTTTNDTAWLAYAASLSSWGVPADVIATLKGIWDKYYTTADSGAVAASLAKQALRQTTWYKETYKGIEYGIQSGFFDPNDPESAYRAYVNSVNVYAQQHLGRNISGDEILSYLTQGFTPERVEKGFQATDWTIANTKDVQLLSGSFGTGNLSAEQLKALGETKVGIGNQIGETIQNALAKAERRLETMFGGTTATGNVSLAGGKLTVGAMKKPGQGDLAA
jgi:hypothetical protein